MQSGVHRSLVSADNALMLQSERHPDGWGVAYYIANAPHVIKSASAAVSDHLFRHVSGIVTSETVLAHIRKAVKLGEAGVKSPATRKAAAPKPPPKAPADLLAALKASPAAKATFDGFAPSHRREYIEWITEARREETRANRLAQAVEWMAEGKRRHWKYENC